MTKAKVEDMNNQLIAINNSITELNSTFSTRIDALEQKLSTDIHDIRQKIETDICLLRTDVDTIRTTVDENQNSVEFNHKKLEDELLSLQEINQARDLKDVMVDEKVEEIGTLKSKIVKLEKALHAGLQHNRKYNLEIDGIPLEVDDDHLEAAAINIIKSIGVPYTSDDIEIIHRLPSKKPNQSKPTIIKFKNRKTVELALKNKSALKDLHSLGLKDFIPGINDDTRIFLRASLCPYYSNLAYNCRLLKKHNLIAKALTCDDGSVKIVTFQGNFIKIIHESDLTSKFQNFDFSFN